MAANKQLEHEQCVENRNSFSLFKSNVCHCVKEMGDIDFIIDTLECNKIRRYYQRGWYPECFYLLAMLDYLSRLNDVPLCTEYEDIRHCRLKEPVFPSGILIVDLVEGNDMAKKQALQDAIPEFLRFNIIESEVRDVI